jgi:hypothetical protein
VVSGVAALIAFATISVNAYFAYSPPAALVLFATGLSGLTLLGWRRKRRAS